MLHTYSDSYICPYCGKFQFEKHQLPGKYECEHIVLEHRVWNSFEHKVCSKELPDLRCSVCGTHSLRETHDKNLLECRKCGSVVHKLAMNKNRTRKKDGFQSEELQEGMTPG
jgi:ribosomal protein L37AE/L43A